MPFYNYTCSQECTASQLTDEQRDKIFLEDHPDDILIWTERHGMHDTPDIECPICGTKAVQTLYGSDQQFYIKGNCYLNRKDAQRQMDIRTLESGNDPYAHMRQPGEVDELKSKLRKKKTPRK